MKPPRALHDDPEAVAGGIVTAFVQFVAAVAARDRAFALAVLDGVEKNVAHAADARGLSVGDRRAVFAAIEAARAQTSAHVVN